MLIHVMVFPVITLPFITEDVVTVQEYVVQDVQNLDEYSPDDSPEDHGNCMDDVSYLHDWLGFSAKIAATCARGLHK